MCTTTDDIAHMNSCTIREFRNVVVRRGRVPSEFFFVFDVVVVVSLSASFEWQIIFQFLLDSPSLDYTHTVSPTISTKKILFKKSHKVHRTKEELEVQRTLHHRSNRHSAYNSE